jgi:hypothetical protein
MKNLRNLKDNENGFAAAVGGVIAILVSIIEPFAD